MQANEIQSTYLHMVRGSPYSSTQANDAVGEPIARVCAQGKCCQTHMETRLPRQCPGAVPSKSPGAMVDHGVVMQQFAGELSECSEHF